jgi:uncharacterized protein
LLQSPTPGSLRTFARPMTKYKPMSNHAKYRFASIYLLLYLLLFGTQARADTLAYDVTLDTATQSETERNQAIRNGLAELFIRVSGARSVLQAPAIRQELASPTRYLLQYGYIAIPQAEQDAEHRNRLQLRYDVNAVLSALQRNGLSIWAQQRPAALMWWGAETSAGRVISNAETAADSSKTFNKHAQRRGITLLFPLLDLEDTNAVNPLDLWGLASEPLLAASHRYATDVVVMGRMIQRPDTQWDAKWQISVNGEEKKGEIQAQSQEQIIANVVDALADMMGQQFAVTMQRNAGEGFIIAFEHVNDFSTYAAIDTYLHSIIAVKDATLKTINGQRVEYNIRLNTDIEQFQRIIQGDNKLQLLPANTPNNTPEISPRILVYGWKP